MLLAFRLEWSSVNSAIAAVITVNAVAFTYVLMAFTEDPVEKEVPVAKTSPKRSKKD